MVHLVIAVDCNPMVFALNLAPVQLARKGCDVRVWSVAPRHEEVGLGGQLLIGGYEVQFLELCDHRFDILVLISYVVLIQILDVLRFNGRNNVLNHYGVHHLLKSVLLPLDLLVLLKLEELAPLYVVLDFWVKELSIGNPPLFNDDVRHQVAFCPC